MIYYFEGNFVNGLDLVYILEDISIDRQEKKFGKVLVNINPLGVKGERFYRVYYLHKYSIKYCNASSLKAFIIRIIGKNVKKYEK